MKTRLHPFLILFIGSLAILGIATLIYCIYTSEWFNEEKLFNGNNERPSVTFLLGEDREDEQYYTLAEEHFLSNELEKTDRVVKSCKTITDMIRYLDEYRDPNQPWGNIEVVVHGNVWSGLSVPMWTDGERAYPTELHHAVMNGDFPKLKTGVIDSNTRANYWACGIGKRPKTKIALTNLLETVDGVKPKVYVSPHFVLFSRDPETGESKRLSANYWPYFFKRGYRPPDISIANNINEVYQGDPKIIQTALRENQFENDSSLFSNEFHIPVSWTLIYPDKESRPKVETEDEKLTWVRSQPELMKQIEILEIPIEKFRWTVDKILYNTGEGTVEPAIKAIGMCTVLCVLETLDT